jgi:hypothetical protein
MARTQTSRFNLWRWSVDSDTQGRADFDSDNAQLEALALIGINDLRANRPAAGIRDRVFFAKDTGQAFYDTGTLWYPMGAQGFIDSKQTGSGVILTTTNPTEATATRISIAAQATPRRYKVETYTRFGLTTSAGLFKGGAMLNSTAIDPATDWQDYLDALGGGGQSGGASIRSVLVPAGTAVVFSAYGQRVQNGSTTDSLVTSKCEVTDVGGV